MFVSDRALVVRGFHVSVRLCFVRTTTFLECSHVDKDNLQYQWDTLLSQRLRLMISNSAGMGHYTRYCPVFIFVLNIFIHHNNGSKQ